MLLNIVFLFYSKVNHVCVCVCVCVCVYPLYFGFSSYLGHHSVFSRVPSAMQCVLISMNNNFCRGCGDK